MVASLPSTPARRPRSPRAFSSIALLVATLIGPSCHDATGPTSALVPTPSFTIVSGDAQTGPAGKELPLALVAKATNSAGTALAGITVFFVVTQGGGKLYAGGGVTNSSGEVRDYWTLGPGVGPQKVAVRAVDPTTGAKRSYGTFAATATVGPAKIIKVSAGDGQTAFTRALLAIKPAVLVTDAFGNPVGGVSVDFAVTAGEGAIGASPAITNVNGVATLPSWRMGRAPGANRLAATISGLTVSAIFRATAKFGMKLVETGGNHSCGLSAANDVYCWGSNAAGQLGDGTTTHQHAPVKLIDAALRPPSLALGAYHTCLLLSTGKAHCWGDNVYGQLGDATNTTRSTPAPVRTTRTFTRIASYFTTVCALTSTGEPWCWGSNVSGQFGDGSNSDSNVPVLAAGGMTFASIYIGGSHTCALTAIGEAWCWGENFYGQLGDATNTQRYSPVQVSTTFRFTSLVLGPWQTCGLIAGGKAYCWGLNAQGQLGDGTTTSATSPQPVSGGLYFTQLAAAGHTCGLTFTGVAYCWGWNDTGAVGAGFRSGPVLVPTAVASSGRTFSAIHAGYNSHTCVVPVGGGNPFCWGSNNNGQVGDGTTFNALLPVQVLTPAIP